MIISNNNIVIQSSYIRDIAYNYLDFTRIELEATKDCTTVFNYTLPIGPRAWYFDLDIPTRLENILTRLYVTNLQSFYSINALSAPIDLGYVEDNCSGSPCTLEAFGGTFIPQFKSQIDGWFASIGIITNVTVSFIGNVLKLENFPVDFVPDFADYGVNPPYSRIYSSYGAINSQIFLSSSALHIKPSFFGVDKHQDGVYKFKIKYVRSGGVGHVIEENCSFLDIETKCKLASLLENLSKNSNSDVKGVSTNVHLLHYALINASNCGCACDEMCIVYKELKDILDGLDPQTLDCGC